MELYQRLRVLLTKLEKDNNVNINQLITTITILTNDILLHILHFLDVDIISNHFVIVNTVYQFSFQLLFNFCQLSFSLVIQEHHIKVIEI